MAAFAREFEADVIAVSTYNGVASSFICQLTDEIEKLELQADVYIGGRLNAVPDGSNTGIPVDDLNAIKVAGAIPCARVEDMLIDIAHKNRNTP